MNGSGETTVMGTPEVRGARWTILVHARRSCVTQGCEELLAIHVLGDDLDQRANANPRRENHQIEGATHECFGKFE